MKPKEIINELALTKKQFTFNEDAILEPYSICPNTCIQYGTKKMREVFGTDIHYEIKTYYSRICVYLHDERYSNDNLWAKLIEIAKWHELSDGYSIYYCSEKISALDSETARAIVTQGLHELFRAFNPFFNYILSEIGTTGNRENLICEYQVERDRLSSSDVIRRLVKNDIPLNLDNDLIMQPNERLKDCNGFAGYQVYKSYLSNDAVHFEVRTEGNEICVELHDERKSADTLHRILYKEAIKHKLRVDCNDTYLWIGSNTRVPCNRTWQEIISDIAIQMKVLWNIYGKLLDEMSSDGFLKQSVAAMPPLADLPKKEYDPSIKKRREIDVDTLCWVTTVKALVNRDPIKFSNTVLDQIQMRPGEYIIPTYQRRYAWTKENVTQLCRDLLRAYHQHRKEYHLGTLIFHAPRIEDVGNSFFVVDGQQRLRTISRLLEQKIFTENENFQPEKQFSSENEKDIWECLQRFGNDKKHILDMLKKSTFVCIAVSDINESFQLFSTQNGRGKTLSPENLLKAYHFHEIQDAEIHTPEQLDKMDEEWEQLNQKPTTNDGFLLQQVIGEHLYRIRCWLLGDFPREPFSLNKVNAFKGLTVSTRNDGQQNSLPLGNLSVLRQNGDVNDTRLAHRSASDHMNPFVFIDQPIVNGSDFFAYTRTYCDAYETLFGYADQHVDELAQFYFFYATYCLYPCSGRRGDIYARHIFQSLCLYCYDRFGASGLMENQEYLYCCSYYERAVNVRCYYQTCGRTYAVTALQIMAGASNLSDLSDRLCALYLKVCEQFEFQGAAMVSGLECVLSVFAKEA